jgi:hypothetical protein
MLGQVVLAGHMLIAECSKVVFLVFIFIDETSDHALPLWLCWNLGSFSLGGFSLLRIVRGVVGRGRDG